MGTGAGLRLGLAAALLLGGTHASWADSEAGVCAPSPMPAAPLRRLTRWEYINTVRDLLGPVDIDVNRFPEEGGSGFDNNADVAVATRIHAQKYMSTAEALAAQVTRDVPKLLGCSAQGAAETTCMQRFISRFATRAWRRPLSATEQASLWAFYQEQRAEHTQAEAVGLLLQALLESPHFLYRVEVGQEDAAHPTRLRLTDWELASRLSYFIWGSMPSPRLFNLAKAQRLHTAAQVRQAAQWMLRDPRARLTVRRFAEQWMGLPLLDRLDKDRARFPIWNKDIAKLMREQFERFIDHVVWQADGRLETLLTTPITFMNKPLAAFLNAGEVNSPQWQKVKLPEAVGLFTLPAFLAMQSNVEETSPIKRGIFVREQLLCQIPPPPPPNLMMNMLPPATPDLVTVRERLEEHKLGFGCAKCHELFDPLGFAFEGYDTLGRRRYDEGGHALDTTGELVQSDVDGPFTDGVQLAQRLANSQMVRDCFVKQWFRFAFARTESEADDRTLRTLSAAFSQKRHRVLDLILAIVQTEAFLYRPAPTATLARSTP